VHNSRRRREAGIQLGESRGGAFRPKRQDNNRLIVVKALTYRRLADKRLGLSINFNAALIEDGISRIVNEQEEESHAKAQARQEHK
jgi:hypothetical protein